MLQKFFDNTMISKAIKYILSKTPLPMYKTITADEYIYKGCTYIYKHDIIKCTKSGYFMGIKTSNFVDDYLYVSNEIMVTDNKDFIKGIKKVKDDDGKTRYVYEYKYLTVTDKIIRRYLIPFSKFEVIDDFNFGEFTPGITQYYKSNTNYYDSETHKYLGEYLRCLRDIKGIDLMGLYNCFEYKYVNNIKFTDKEVIETQNNNTKITLIPIKFNKTYTIALDCLFDVKMTPILYNDKLLQDYTNNTYLYKILKDKIYKYNNFQFSNPITYKLKQESQDILKYEKYLYLAIELPNNNESSIVVLEGDYSYTSAERYVSNIESMNELPDATISRIFRPNLSLLSVNDGLQHPFSDKLIEFLLEHTIDNRDMVDENIEYIEKLVDFTPEYYGNWSPTLRYLLYNRYMNLNDSYEFNKKDVLGFVDSDIENAVTRGYLRNVKG